jgi:uncharacterized protein involved in exopolysaccharide biosynthesis
MDEAQDDDESGSQALSAGRLFARLRAGWRAIAAALLVWLVLAFLYLAVAVPKYRAELVLIPAPVNQSGGLGAAKALGGLASLAGIDLEAGAPVAPFDVFRAVLTGGDVARAVATPQMMRGTFPDRWDPERQDWKPETGFVAGVKGALASIGLPDLRQGNPDWRLFRTYLQERVKTTKGIETPVFTVSFEHPDPEFARTLLLNLRRAADDHVRARDKARAEASIAHLSKRLDQEVRMEHRVVLAAALGEQERILMMATSESPYAAELVEDAYVSRRPVSPNVGLMLAGALFAGLLSGVVLALTLGGPARRV